MVIGGLMKRILNQIPILTLKPEQREELFETQMTNFYLLLNERIMVKDVYKVSLGISTEKAEDRINKISENVLSIIVDYN